MPGETTGEKMELPECVAAARGHSQIRIYMKQLETEVYYDNNTIFVTLLIVTLSPADIISPPRVFLINASAIGLTSDER